MWESVPDLGILRVWAEPVEKRPNFDDGTPSIMELEVHAINYLGHEPMKGWAIPRAMPSPDCKAHNKTRVRRTEF